MEDKNNTNHLDIYEKILDRSDKEINKIHSMYKLAAWLVTGAATIITLLGAFIFFNNMNELKEDARKRVDDYIESANKDINDFKVTILNKMNLSSDSIKTSFNENLIRVGNKVNNRIDEEFKEKNISQRIERKIDTVNNQIIEDKIKDKVLPEIDRTEKNISELEFKLTEIAIMNDDRRAFDKVTSWANDNSNRFHKQATELREKILNINYEFYIYTFMSARNEGFKVETSSVTEIKKAYYSVTRENRKNIIYEIGKKINDNKTEKINFLIEIIENDESLSCVAKASNIIINEYKLNFKPLEIDKILEWYKINKSKI